MTFLCFCLFLCGKDYNNRGKEDIKNEKTFIVTFSFASISTYILR